MEYVVKEIATATDDNPNFAGETQIFYIGKGGRIYYDLRWCEGWSRERFAKDYIRRDSEWSSKNERYWTYQYELIRKEE